jgi:hypothetical protein
LVLPLVLLLGMAAALARRPASRPAQTDAAATAVAPTDVPLDAVATIPGVEEAVPAVVAVVNGEQITAAELTRQLNVARVLASLAGDSLPPPAGDSQLRGFLVVLLKRLVDLRLLRQAAEQTGVTTNESEVDTLLNGYLAQTGKTRADLDVEVARQGSSMEDVQKWFRVSAVTNRYIQEHILPAAGTTDRNAASQQWLDQAWSTNAIQVNFFDPSEVSPGQFPTAPPAIVPTATQVDT